MSTTVPILAKGKTETGRVWTYVRDDRPFGGKDPPAALFYASRDRRGEHPERHLTNWSGILQADAFSGYARLYKPDRKPGPIVEALCWSHARRKFFELADIAANARRGKNAAPISPIALEAVKRIDAIFDIEREINGLSAEERLAARRSRCAPLVAALEEWTRSGTRQALPAQCRRQGHRLYAHPLAGLLPLPRRRTYLSYEQRGGTSAARPGLGPKIMALRRLRARG